VLKLKGVLFEEILIKYLAVFLQKYHLSKKKGDKIL
jgi:hypothetical protein